MNGVRVAAGGVFGFNVTVPIDAAPVWVAPAPLNPGQTVTMWNIVLGVVSGSRLVIAIDNTYVPPGASCARRVFRRC